LRPIRDAGSFECICNPGAIAERRFGHRE
jgi:hypothetical protein